MSRRRILVTGGGGFVGKYLLAALAQLQGVELFTSVYHATSDVTDLLPPDHIFEGDLTEYARVEAMVNVARPDLIYHLAALSVVHNSAAQATKIMADNTTLTYNLLEAVRIHAPRARLIAISSANIYGQVVDGSRPLDESTPLRPLNAYAVSKISQEMLALQYHLAYGLDVVILRPFNHTGPGQTTDFVIPALAAQFVQIEQGAEPVIHVGNTHTVRDFTDVTDMVSAYVKAAESCLPGEIYNIGSGVGHTIGEAIEILEQETGRTVTQITDPDKVRVGDVPILIADARKFRDTTSWLPTVPFETTLRRIIEYYRQQSHEER
jgi:GDP-4-dehydro-6-deoxy-D-mannose reductase